MDETPHLTLAEIEETRDMIAPYVVRTPVHDWRGREIEGLLPPATRVNLKLELFQQSGTFKARGAISNILRLTPEDLDSGLAAMATHVGSTCCRLPSSTRAATTARCG